MTGENRQNALASSRAIGLYAVAASLTLSYWFIFLPYRDLVNGHAVEPLNWHGIIVIPLVFGFGVIHGVVGRPAIRFFGTPDAPTKAWWALAAALMLAGVLLIWWLTRVFANFAVH